MTSVKRLRSQSPPAQTPVVVMTGHLFREVYEVFAAEDWAGLRQSHFRLMSYVPREGISVTELGALARMSKQGCGQFVSVLESLGLVQVGADPSDRRVRVVTLTAEGARTLRAVYRRLLRLEREWAERVGPERYREFRSVFEDIVAATGEVDG